MSMLVSAWRSFAWSWKHLWRNAWLAIATVFVLTMTLMSVNVLVAVNALMDRVVTLLENKVDVTVTFQPTTPEAVVNQARFYLDALPQVSDVRIISAAEALTRFRERHKTEPKVIAALGELGTNPLGAQLVVKARHSEDYAFLLQAIHNPAYATFIQSQTYDDHETVIRRVQRVGRNARLFGSGLVALFALFGLLICFNAIRVAIYTQREEIGIMRLVGAPNAFIRWPFLLEGVWLTFAATALSLVVLIPTLAWIDPVLRPLFDGADPGLMTFFHTHALQLAVIEIGGLLFSVLVVSWAAVGKYLHR